MIDLNKDALSLVGNYKEFSIFRGYKMKYVMMTAFGLSLELSKAQADKVLRFGLGNYQDDTYEEGINKQVIFIDGDRWVFEIDIFDETRPLD